MQNPKSLAWQAAVTAGNAAEVARLLKQDPGLVGERIMHTRKNGSTFGNPPLAEANQDLEIAKLLVEAGADVNQHNPDGNGLAINGASFEVGVYLVQNGASIDAFGYEYLTPVAYAVYGNNLPLVQHLLHKGADPNRAHPKEGIAPLHYAARKGDLKMVQMLVSAGGDPLQADAAGKTPVDWASEADREHEILSALGAC